jgi:hypothetical protein
MATLLLEAKDEAGKARAAGKTSLSRRRLKTIAAAYDDLVTRAIRATPDPWLLGREERTTAERKSWNLALAFKELKPRSCCTARTWPCGSPPTSSSGASA